MSDDQRSSTAEREAGKARRVKVHKLADTLMRWLIVLVVAIIFVVLADELITTPFFSAELEGEATGFFSLTVLTVIAYVVGALVGAVVGYILSHFFFAPYLGGYSPYRIQSGISFGPGPSCRNRGLAYWTYNC